MRRKELRSGAKVVPIILLLVKLGSIYRRHKQFVQPLKFIVLSFLSFVFLLCVCLHLWVCGDFFSTSGTRALVVDIVRKLTKMSRLKFEIEWFDEKMKFNILQSSMIDVWV